MFLRIRLIRFVSFQVISVLDSAGFRARVEEARAAVLGQTAPWHRLRGDQRVLVTQSETSYACERKWLARIVNTAAPTELRAGPRRTRKHFTDASSQGMPQAHAEYATRVTCTAER